MLIVTEAQHGKRGCDLMSISDEGRKFRLWVAVVSAVFFSFIFFQVLSESAIDGFISDHGIAKKCSKFLFFESCSYREVFYSELEGWRFWCQIVLPSIIFLLCFPFIGRLVFEIFSALLRGIEDLVGSKKSHTEMIRELDDEKIIIGGCWPLTIFFIPFQVIALLILIALRLSGF